jgi:hypothetical protein
MLMSKNLPGAEIPEVGQVRNEVISQYICEIEEEPFPLLMNDGNLVAFYKFDSDMDMFNTIHGVGEAEFQFYKIHGVWYGAIKIQIQHSLSISKMDLIFGLFKGTRKALNELEAQTDKAMKRFASVKGKFLRFNEIPVFEMIEMDCTSQVPRPTRNLKSNISIMMTGANDFSQVMNISNIDMLPMKHSVLSDDIIRYIAIIKPGQEEEKQLHQQALSRMSVMRILAPKNTNVVRVHTIVGSDEEVATMFQSRLFYMDFNLVVQTRTSLDELESKEMMIRDTLRSSDLSVYTPTNCQRQQFISMLPGLAAYSETMQLASKVFIDKALFRMVSL